MGAVADLLGKSSAELVAEALRLAAEGDRDSARMAALLANDGGGECPFEDPALRAAWGDRDRIRCHKAADAPQEKRVGKWRMRGHRGASAAANDEDWGSLDL